MSLHNSLNYFSLLADILDTQSIGIFIDLIGGFIGGFIDGYITGSSVRKSAIVVVVSHY